ncbi:Uncharacterised protein [Weissella viridescens]|uniref:Uncharacterized protein n=1 Tax=Weissella viridescens TaxID=1629 RepID=A0A380NYK5_WEIVI|nr:Uncharacterised protein [Weissella viridescens]
MILDIDEYDQKISLSQRSIQDLQDIKMLILRRSIPLSQPTMFTGRTSI